MTDTKDVLVHACTVYLYRYDTTKNAYSQQGDSALGCALLGSSGAGASASSGSFRLLFYTSQKQAVLQTSVEASFRFLPQQNNYVNFYDQNQTNFSIRFRDEKEWSQFLTALALTKAQLVLFRADTQQLQPAKGSSLVLNVDNLDVPSNKASANGTTSGLQDSDFAGLALKMWQGSGGSALGEFFSMNPTEILSKTPSESIEKDNSELKRVKLGDPTNDPFTTALCMGLRGMEKHSKRLVTMYFVDSKRWFIAQVELVKVKKGSRTSNENMSSSTATAVTASSAVPTTTSAAGGASSYGEQGDHDEAHQNLVMRMASLSRVGSGRGSALIASLSSRELSHKRESISPQKAKLSSQPSISEYDNGGAKPIMLPGMQQPSAPSAPAPAPAPAPVSTSSSATQPVEEKNSLRNGSFLKKVLESRLSPSPPAHPSAPPSVSAPITPHEAPTLSSYNQPSLNSMASSSSNPERDSLLKEQMELERLQKQFEETKRKIMQESAESNIEDTTSSSFSSYSSNTTATMSMPMATSSAGYGNMPSTSSTTTDSFGGSRHPWNATSSSSFSTSMPSSLPMSFAPSISTDFSTSLPSTSSFMPPLSPPRLAFPSMAPSSSALAITPFSGSSSCNMYDLEQTVNRIQRSSSSMESNLQDIQNKLDRLLNMQSSMKHFKASSSTALVPVSSGSAGGSAASSSGLNSSAHLLKSLEKALSQRDALQEANAELEEAKSSLELRLEELLMANQQLDQQNHHLVSKMSNTNQLQQEKNKMEVRQLEQTNQLLQQRLGQSEKEKAQLQQQLKYQQDQLDQQLAMMQHRMEQETKNFQFQKQQELEKQFAQEKNQLLSQVQQFQLDQSRFASEKAQLDQQKQVLEAQQAQVEQKLRDRTQQVERLQQELANVKQTHALALEQQAQQSVVDREELAKQLIDMDQRLRATRAQQAEWQHQREQHEEQLNEQRQEILKEFMNDVYFSLQDSFEEENAEYTGKEIGQAIRKILKQKTMEILEKFAQPMSVGASGPHADHEHEQEGTEEEI